MDGKLMGLSFVTSPLIGNEIMRKNWLTWSAKEKNEFFRELRKTSQK